MGRPLERERRRGWEIILTRNRKRKLMSARRDWREWRLDRSWRHDAQRYWIRRRWRICKLEVHWDRRFDGGWVRDWASSLQGFDGREFAQGSDSLRDACVGLTQPWSITRILEFRTSFHLIATPSIYAWCGLFVLSTVKHVWKCPQRLLLKFYSVYFRRTSRQI